MNAWQQIAHAAADEHRTFRESLGNPRTTQLVQLRAIIDANRDSEFGREHTFGAIGDIDEFRAKVPICTYADLEPSISRMAQGEEHVLCASPVYAYEETSGSSGAAKYIPYTRAAIDGFRRAALPWLAELLRARAQIHRGRAYFALSPVTRPKRTLPDGAPVGLSSEAEYLGEDVAQYFTNVSVVPPALAAISDRDAWQYLTLRFLLDAEDLTLISVWSPTFLFPLIEQIRQDGERLINDVATGRISLSDQYQSFANSFVPNPKRADVIERALAGTVPDTRLLWPYLDTISCWADAGSRRFIPRVREMFPHAFIQGKGLLATEGAVTIPFGEQNDPVLAVQSGFFEFMDERGVCHLCDEVAQNAVYRVVLTMHGGLYRYDLGDQMRVRGWIDATPTFEFVGRAGLVSDLCGEKLSDDFVSPRLDHIRGFSMLAPAISPHPHYVLFVDEDEFAESDARELADRLDMALADNPQYSYARRLGQLGPVRPRRVVRALDKYVKDALDGGQRLGDIKAPVLRVETDWEQRLAVI